MKPLVLPMQILTFGNVNMIQDAEARGQQRQQQRSSKIVELVHVAADTFFVIGLSTKANILLLIPCTWQVI